jgi:hypothetical protein
MIIPAETDMVLELDDFMAHLDRHLDVESEDSLVAMAPQLVALANNRRFLARQLAATIGRPDFQQNNPFTGPVFVLANRRHFMVRAIGWPPAAANTGAGYNSTYRVAHNHAFSLLTVGYWGPGYQTDIFTCPPETLAKAANGSSAELDLPFIGRYRLAERTVLHLPAHRIVHVQHPPESYSISLNLVVKRSADDSAEQYFFDVDSRRYRGSTGTTSNAWLRILHLASRLPDPRYDGALMSIAKNHPSLRIRTVAGEALRRAVASPDAVNRRESA